MRMKMTAIIENRGKVQKRHRLHSEIREVKLLPMQEEAPYLMNSSNATAHDYLVTLATVKYEQYGPLILEVPDPPELEALRENVAQLKIQVEVLRHSKADYYGLYCELLFSPNEPPENLKAYKLEQHDKGVDSAIAELTICYRVALDEHKDLEDAEVLEGLIDRLQALKENK